MARIVPCEQAVDPLAAFVGAGLSVSAGALLSVGSSPGLEVTRLRGMLHGGSRAGFLQVGASEEERRRAVPAGERLRNVTPYGEEIADG